MFFHRIPCAGDESKKTFVVANDEIYSVVGKVTVIKLLHYVTSYFLK